SRELICSSRSGAMPMPSSWTDSITSPACGGRHARPAGRDPHPTHPQSPPDPYQGELTGTGLPKRTPRTVPQPPPVQRVRKGVDAEALRARLAGFQQGAREGRRDVEQELAGRDGDRRRAAPPPHAGGDVGDVGGIGDVEEARG
ncbi:histidine kinase, partial [Streptomyces sp. URMC 126]